MWDKLKSLGLDEKEARVYLAILELGIGSVTQISQKAEINRTTGYDILEKLCISGLVGRSFKGKKQIYNAEHPSHLLSFLNNQKKKCDFHLEAAQKILPKLNTYYYHAPKPVIRFAEGKEGLKRIYLETLFAKKEILSCLDYNAWSDPELDKWARNYEKERTKRKIHERLLVLKTPESAQWVKKYPVNLEYTSVRWMPYKSPFLFENETNIFDDKIMIVFLKSPNYAGMMIENKELNNLFKALFEMAWQTAEKYEGGNVK